MRLLRQAWREGNTPLTSSMSALILQAPQQQGAARQLALKHNIRVQTNTCLRIYKIHSAWCTAASEGAPP